jgi:hypothetical protein
VADNAQAMIHKVVYQLAPSPLAMVQEFTVPTGAQVVAVDRDTRDPLGIAVWYRFWNPPISVQTWRLSVVGTGQPFPVGAVALGTVLMGEFAWHLLDLDGTVTRQPIGGE